MQYDETNADQNEQMALRPKARPLRRDPRHGAMAATGGDGGRDGHGDRDDPRRNDRASPEPEAEDNEEDSVEETGTQEFMYRMKRGSGELTGRKNKFPGRQELCMGATEASKGAWPHGQVVPERRGKGSRVEESTITHSVTSPTTGWQRIYAKGKQPRALRVSNQGGKGSGGRIVMQGKGTNPAAELQLAQSMSRAAAAIWRAESAVSTHGNGSEGAEAAYDEAAEAVSQFLEADAVLHPPNRRFKLQRSHLRAQMQHQWEEELPIWGWRSTATSSRPRARARARQAELMQMQLQMKKDLTKKQILKMKTMKRRLKKKKKKNKVMMGTTSRWSSR